MKNRDAEREKVKEKKKKFSEEYSPKVEAEGYHLAHGISLVKILNPSAPVSDLEKFCLVAYLQPLSGKPDKITKEDMNKIKDQVLPKEYEGIQVYVKWMGRVYPA